MHSNFLNLAATTAVTAEQQKYYGRATTTAETLPPDELSDVERGFIAARDSFYMATVTETGWPYVQHRGGPPGFLQVLGPRTLAFADLKGNRQMLSTGNLRASDRVALFLMDYPQRARLKILGHAIVRSAVEQGEFAAQLMRRFGGEVERIITIEVVGFDWNCPKYITPRYTMSEIESLVAPLKSRIEELEKQSQAARQASASL